MRDSGSVNKEARPLLVLSWG